MVLLQMLDLNISKNKALFLIQKYDYINDFKKLYYYKKSEIIIHNKNVDFKLLVHKQEAKLISEN